MRKDGAAALSCPLLPNPGKDCIICPQIAKNCLSLRKETEAAAVRNSSERASKTFPCANTGQTSSALNLMILIYIESAQTALALKEP